MSCVVVNLIMTLLARCCRLLEDRIRPLAREQVYKEILRHQGKSRLSTWQQDGRVRRMRPTDLRL